MPQSVLFKGYRVSGAAREDDGKWQVSYVIEKDRQLVQKAAFVLCGCAIGAAENAAVLRGLQCVNEWDDE
jgi:hypothetical protein